LNFGDRGGLLRCQKPVRDVALICNWWSSFVRCADPHQPPQAVASQPLLMSTL